MAATTRQVDVLLWRYSCPDCGVTDAEAGYYAPAHMIMCEICLEDGRQVRLRRWPFEDEASGTAPGTTAGS